MGPVDGAETGAGADGEPGGVHAPFIRMVDHAHHGATVNAILNTLATRGLRLVLRNGRLRVRGTASCDDLLPAMRERREALERRVRWDEDLTCVSVRSRVRGREILLGRGGDYAPSELAAIDGFSPRILKFIDTIKREFVECEIEYQTRTP